MLSLGMKYTMRDLICGVYYCAYQRSCNVGHIW